MIGEPRGRAPLAYNVSAPSDGLQGRSRLEKLKFRHHPAQKRCVSAPFFGADTPYRGEDRRTKGARVSVGAWADHHHDTGTRRAVSTAR